MKVSPDKIAEVCALGPVKASELLDRGRAGDQQALVDWSVYALYRQFRRIGADHEAALKHTSVILDRIDLTTKVSA